MQERKNKKQRIFSEINITPLTDVSLVLLLIFMITTPIIYQSNIKINLPKAKSGVALEKAREEQTEIIITQEGMVYLDGKIVTRKELRLKISEKKKENPDLSVVVRSDKFVRFQEIVDVLDPLVELGITKLNIGVTKEE
ncbi:MAG TPA: biopolymer transporter ExbD [Candidatus Omnitrophota bacterium]|nr:biopolymer transporter ExbD [Candidatus Omnitrophota bacterium]HPN89067.1 biopolymer transporter ExbD [Candidatus Omnitrophota bacterium]